MIKFTRNHTLVFCGILFVLFFSLLFIYPPTQVKAAGIDYKTISEMTPAEQVASYSYYLALKNCITKDDTFYKAGPLTGTSVLEMFNNSTNTNIVDLGYIADNVAGTLGTEAETYRYDARMSCRKVAEAAFKLWGITDASIPTFLTDLGYSIETKTNFVFKTTYYSKKEKNKYGAYLATSSTEDGTLLGVYPDLVFSSLDFTNHDAYTLRQDIRSKNETIPLPSNSFEDRIPSVANTIDKDNNGKIDTFEEASNLCGVFHDTDSSVITTTNIWELNPPSDIFTNQNICEQVATDSQPGSEWTTPNFLSGFENLILTHIYEGSQAGIDTTPPNYKGLKYYIYKYYLENEHICNAKNEGVVDDAFVEDPRKSVFAVYLPDEKGILVKYAYRLDTDAWSNGGFIMDAGLKRLQCSDLLTELNTSAKGIADDIIANKNLSSYSEVLSASNLTLPGKETDTKTGKTTCAINGLGWIVCPVMTFLGGIADKAFTFLADSFLSTNVHLLNTDSRNNNSVATYTAWKAMRSIANVAFVIVFLVIIFSQITSFGVSNYGIKKILPRLIIAAILVNISFYICQIAVDLSNILGYSLKGLFDSLGGLMQTPGVIVDASGNPWGIALLVAGIIAGGLTLVLAISIPVILAVIVALLMIVLILVARTGLIILLVVIAPLAFIAFMLPNTEKLFEKWGKTFVNLLLVFPIISVVFGAGNLAGRIINASDPTNPLLQLLAIGVVAMPLFAVPGLLKNSMKAAGSIGTKLAGLGSKVNGRISDKVKNTSILGAYKSARDRNSQIKRAQITGGVYRGRNRITRLISGRNALLNSAGITGEMGNRTAQQAAQLANKLDIENVTAASAQIQQANITSADLGRIANGETIRGINGRDAATNAAAMGTLLQRGQFADFQTAWNGMITHGSSDRNGAERMRMVASTLMGSKDRPVFMGAGDLQMVQEGHTVGTNNTSLGLQDMAQRGASRYSPNKLAATSNDEIEYVVASNGGLNLVPANSPLRQAAYTAINNPEISQGIGNNRQNIEQLANGWTPPAPAQQSNRILDRYGNPMPPSQNNTNNRQP
ncbi:MAG: hypothetical protein ACYCX2_01405 [Christensenellales bacterium]